jgi:hypothetical protein
MLIYFLVQKRIQTEGMGGLRHNTIVLNWPEKWNKDYFSKSNVSDDDENSLSLSSFVRKLNAHYFKRNLEIFHYTFKF